MKIAYLAPRNSIHTVRWVNSLADRGHTITLITLHKGGEALNQQVKLIKLPFPAPIGYFLNSYWLKRILRRLQPDLLHVHYASGYGTLGRLSGFQPLVLSAWGSDIYDFPRQSQLQHNLLVKNLQAAQHICSTSHVMREEIRHFCSNKPITVTPFGIDTKLFYPRPELRDNSVINIGTVKSLEPVYGIDTLIWAFHHLRHMLSANQSALTERLRLCIAGHGSQYKKLQKLVARLNLTKVTQFSGHIPYHQVSDYLNKLDIYVAASRQESFGVAVLEASACGLPVVVAKVGGLPEVVEHEMTGYVIDTQNLDYFALTLLKLVFNQALRNQLGHAGRQWVLKKYNWQESVTLMENVYSSIC